MLVSKKSKILFFACICAFACVITTIGIHSNLFDFGPLTFEQRAELHDNSWYTFSKWWVIIHCLFVVFSMWGILLIQGKKKLPLTGLGFLFYCVFSFTEIFRQLLALFYWNGLRQKYLLEEDLQMKEIIANSIDNFGPFANAMFALFILAFALGNLMYGLSLIKESKLDNILGILLLIWALQGFITLGSEFWDFGWFNIVMEKFSLIFQPLIRLSIGIWFVAKLKSFYD